MNAVNLRRLLFPSGHSHVILSYNGQTDVAFNRGGKIYFIPYPAAVIIGVQPGKAERIETLLRIMEE